jgi:hypothetical protein
MAGRPRIKKETPVYHAKNRPGGALRIYRHLISTYLSDGRPPMLPKNHAAIKIAAIAS